MGLYGKKHEYTWWNLTLTAAELAELRKAAKDPTEKRLLSLRLGQVLGKYKKSADSEWSQKQNYMLFQLGGLTGNLSRVLHTLQSMQDNPIGKEYPGSYAVVRARVNAAYRYLKVAEADLRAITVMKKKDDADNNRLG